MPRTIERTGQFRKDFKREAKGLHRPALSTDLAPIIQWLVDDKPLQDKHRDQALDGNWKDHRDCHIKPDDATLQLVRLGSHSEIGLLKEPEAGTQRGRVGRQSRPTPNEDSMRRPRQIP